MLLQCGAEGDGRLVGQGLLRPEVQPVGRGGFGTVERVADHERGHGTAVLLGEGEEDLIAVAGIALGAELGRLFQEVGVLVGPDLGIGGEVRGEAGLSREEQSGQG